MTHDVSSTLVDSEPCMCGSATLVMLVSRICITVISMTEIVISHLRAGERSSAGCRSSVTVGSWRAGAAKSTRRLVYVRARAVASRHGLRRGQPDAGRRGHAPPAAALGDLSPGGAHR